MMLFPPLIKERKKREISCFWLFKIIVTKNIIGSVFQFLISKFVDWQIINKNRFKYSKSIITSEIFSALGWTMVCLAAAFVHWRHLQLASNWGKCKMGKMPSHQMLFSARFQLFSTSKTDFMSQFRPKPSNIGSENEV